MSKDLTKFGGRFVSPHEIRAAYGFNSAEGYWDMGCKPPWTLSAHQQTAVEQVYNSLRLKPYQQTIHVNDDVDDIDLTKLWGHATVVAGLGKPFIGFGQYTGSCVGAGGGNTQMTLICAEVVLLGQPEKIYMPWWGVQYGRSRYYMGDRSRGEGSLESCWMKACVDGVLPAGESGLPTYSVGDSLLQMGGSTEMAWSDGDSKPLIDFLTRSRQFPIQGAEIIRSVDDAWNAIGEFKPIGHGSMYGYTVTGRDENGEYLGKRGPRWAHKETILGRRIYQGKRWFKNVNQWFYQGACRVWIPEEDVAWIINDGEIVAYSGLQGIPEEKLRWEDRYI